MKRLLYGLIFLGETSLGQIVGNGGDAIVCENPSRNPAMRGERVVLFDYYEAASQRGLIHDLGPRTFSYQEKVRLAISRLVRLDPVRYQLYRNFADNFDNEADVQWAIHLPKVSDEDAIKLPSDVTCSVNQLAYFQDAHVKGEPGSYSIDASLWDQMSADQRAGLILHEIIYREARRHGHRNSRAARHLNALISSREFNNITLSEYKKILKEEVKLPLLEEAGPKKAKKTRVAGKNLNPTFSLQTPLAQGPILPVKGKYLFGSDLFFASGKHMKSLGDMKVLRSTQAGLILISDQSGSDWYWEVFDDNGKRLARMRDPTSADAMLIDSGRMIVTDAPLKVFDTLNGKLLYQDEQPVVSIKDLGDRLLVIRPSQIDFFSYRPFQRSLSKAYNGNFRFWFSDGKRFFSDAAGLAFVYDVDTKRVAGPLSIAGASGAVGGLGNYVWTSDRKFYQLFSLSNLKNPRVSFRSTSGCGGKFLDIDKQKLFHLKATTGEIIPQLQMPVRGRFFSCHGNEVWLQSTGIAVNQKGTSLGRGFFEFIRPSTDRPAFAVTSRSGSVWIVESDRKGRRTTRYHRVSGSYDYIYADSKLQHLFFVKGEELGVLALADFSFEKTTYRSQCPPSLSPNGRFLIEVRAQGARIIDIEKRQIRYKWPGTFGCHIGFAPDGQRYTLSSDDGTRIYQGDKLLTTTGGKSITWISNEELVVLRKARHEILHLASGESTPLPPGRYTRIDDEHFLRTHRVRNHVIKSLIYRRKDMTIVFEHVGKSPLRPVGNSEILFREGLGKISVASWR